ncbi:hypothetical protein SBA3_5050003 [Candidatus Sulfopaludibacter sp. SbA3]|nr:hypothetical protein SBA3_5050003 [Candidatus Sulfopaludibacter sp. SbA3]
MPSAVDSSASTASSWDKGTAMVRPLHWISTGMSAEQASSGAIPWEDRIHNEAIAGANGPEEQVMGWYYYVDDKIRFPLSCQVRGCRDRFTAKERGNCRSPAPSWMRLRVC